MIYWSIETELKVIPRGFTLLYNRLGCCCRFVQHFFVLQGILEAIRRLPSPPAHSSARGGRASKEIPLVAFSELGNTFFGTEDQKLIEEQASLVYLKRWLD